jgi:hypothetical protein
MWQTINFNVLIQLLLPTFLRKNRMIAFLTANIKPLDSLYKNTLYKMQHTCQVISLEKMLNEHFAVANYNPNNHQNTKVITITDEYFPPENYIYMQAENPPSVDYDNQDLWIDVDNIFLEDDLPHFDFVVNIPASITFIEAQLRAIIDYYKLAGKKYRIAIAP